MMYVHHYVSKAFMKSSDLDSGFLAGILQLIVEVFYEVFWGFWHIASNNMALDTGIIYLKNWQFYKRHKMLFSDCKKANLLTLRVYESLLESGFFNIESKEKQYYSFLHDRYYEVVKLPKIYVIIYQDINLKQHQKLLVEFSGAQVKAIQSDDFLITLNQTLASIDNNLSVETPTARAGWLIYQVNDEAVNYRIDLTSNEQLDLNTYDIYLDHSHIWNLKSQFGGLIAGASGAGKTALLLGIIDQILRKDKIELYVGDGKNDQLGSLCKVILSKEHTFVGEEVATLVHNMYKEMKERYNRMSAEREKNPRALASADFEAFGYHMIVFIIDEQSITLESLEKKQADRYVSELLQLAHAARACGIIPIISMQQASAENLGGKKGTAIRDQLTGCRIIMGSAQTISAQNKLMVFGPDIILPEQKHKEVGIGYVRTSSMASPEGFISPLLPKNNKKLYDLLLKDAEYTSI